MIAKTSSEQARNLKKLQQRIGSPHLRQRLWLQSEYVHKKFGKGRTFVHFENFDWVHRAISGLVKISGLYGRGSSNSRKFEINTNRIDLAALPRSFAGFRILHLTDMHLDSDSSLREDLRAVLKDIDHDLCVITGDFRFATRGDYRKCLEEVSKVVDILPNPIYAVLGNHDFIEMVPPLEEMGIQFLLNEATKIKLGDEEIWLAGVDDPHFYQVDDLQKAHDGVGTDTAVVLLSHSPEIYRRAAAFGFDLMLCGHTHAGQICLPGGIPIVTNGNCPREYVSGRWNYDELVGYTARGVGCSGVPLRFNCPPEIVVHELHTVPSGNPSGREEG